ncbi:MAG: hydantoinase B/oxoprolinase family protein [Alphaproteobacteria bacterium]|nr:hydantoinase B/oxoprolinase family protein [Alphaproteobacteria bacterium]
MLDPITLALTQKRLDHISQQMGWVMMRTSRSPILSQSHDFSCFITDGAGSLVSQADGIPIHSGGGGFAVRALLKAFAGRVEPDDVFLLSDPFVAGGNHLPDWVIARPVFANHQLMAFACNRAHQSDIGGGAAGTYNSSATEIFEEGIRLPALRLVERGKMREDLWQFLLLNSRTPQLLDGDLRAMMGSARIGAEQITTLIESLGLATAAEYFAGIMGHAERRLRAVVDALPRGVYRGESRYDDDCFDPVDLRIRVTLTVDERGLTFDFTGTDAQLRGFKNSSIVNTHSAVYTAVTTFFSPDIPRNEGTFRPIRLIAPEGSIVNPRLPAATTMCTLFPTFQIIHACWQALAHTAPDRAIAGWGPSVFPITAGLHRNGETFVMYHWGCNSGIGGVAERDGFDLFGPIPTFGGLIIPNAETDEQLYPVHIRRQELRADAAGAGQFRGGTGADYEVDVLVPTEVTFRAEGLRSANTYGVAGGLPGVMGRMTVTPAGGETQPAPTYGVRRFPPLRVTVASPAGSGYGDPLRRDPARVLRDVRDGIVSADAAKRDYGVVIAAGGRTLDAPATTALRARRAAERAAAE